MESRAKIRRLYFVQKKNIKEIMRELNISRNTVRSVIRSESAGHKYTRSTQPKPRLDDYKEQLLSWLSSDHLLQRKQRRTAKRYHKELSTLGYKGSYDSVCRFVKNWRFANRENFTGFIPLSFKPGEAYQFDWSTEHVELGGVECKIKVAHFRLCYSRKAFLVASYNETQEMLFSAHDKAFIFFAGIPNRGIFDNMKTAVDTIFTKSGGKFNTRFLYLMDHYLIEPTACNPAAGWEKGQVENQVDDYRDSFFKPKVKCKNMDELNELLCNFVQKEAETRKHPEFKNKTVEEVFQEEKLSLRELTFPFNGYREEMRVVLHTCTLSFESNIYSVDCAYINQTVAVRVYPEEIKIVANDGKQIACHKRVFGRHRTIYNPIHYLPLLARKPGALRNGAPFKDWKLPPSIKKAEAIIRKKKGGDKEFVAVLVCLLDHTIEEVEVACDLAISDSVVNKDSIINILNRLKCDEKTEPLKISKSLSLIVEPKGDCSNFDNLLNKKKALEESRV